MARTHSSNPSLSTMGGSLGHPTDDEVSLMELWRVLTKRTGLILSILLMSLIVAGLFIFFTPPVYESRAVLQIGQIGQAGQIESPAILVKRLIVQDKTDGGAAETGKARSFIQAASVERNTNLISITARGPAPRTTQEYLARVIETVMQEHRKLSDFAQKEQQQSLNLLQVRGHEINQAIDAFEKDVRALARQSASADVASPYVITAFAQERSRLFELRMQIEQKQRDLHIAMSELQSKPTALIKAPTLSADPIKPRPLLYFALAIGLGLMLGVSSAFVAEFISKARSEPREAAQK